MSQSPASDDLNNVQSRLCNVIFHVIRLVTCGLHGCVYDSGVSVPCKFGCHESIKVVTQCCPVTL